MKKICVALSSALLILAGCAEKNPVLTVAGGQIQGV